MSWKVEYNVNLSNSFDRVYGFRSLEYRSKLKPLLNKRDVKYSIGIDIIDKIVERTSDKGIDKNGSSFKGYSKSYQESLAWAIYQKTSKVNLKLSGEMLASMIAVDKGGSQITIKFADDLNSAKAHGHINGGKYRKKGARRYPVRDFFGLPQTELDKIVKKNIESASQGNIEAMIKTLVEGLEFKGEFSLGKIDKIHDMTMFTHLSEGL